MSTAPADTLAAPSDEQVMGWLRTMLLIRRFEERAEQLTVRGKIPGGVHPAVGQEATAVGVAAALSAGDTVSASHRGHHHALAKGVPAPGIMAEVYGKATALGRSWRVNASGRVRRGVYRFEWDRGHVRGYRPG